MNGDTYKTGVESRQELLCQPYWLRNGYRKAFVAFTSSHCQELSRKDGHSHAKHKACWRAEWYRARNDSSGWLGGIQHPERIRLSGIDCPEKSQACGKKAKQAAFTLVLGKQVTLQTHGKDEFGRTLADVLLPDGMNLNHTLVKDGWYWWYRKYAPGDSVTPLAAGKIIRWCPASMAS